uniref:Uncharacterized protein n=1 Tax=Arion vulgaris TaxID=1028688 RepID=A0A0B7B080_9EUPU
MQQAERSGRFKYSAPTSFDKCVATDDDSGFVKQSRLLLAGPPAARSDTVYHSAISHSSNSQGTKHDQTSVSVSDQSHSSRTVIKKHVDDVSGSDRSTTELSLKSIPDSDFVADLEKDLQLILDDINIDEFDLADVDLDDVLDD